jgi:acetyl esterase/lipase
MPWRRSRPSVVTAVLLIAALRGESSAIAQVPYAAVADSATHAPAADVRLPYGGSPEQFVELRTPHGTGPHPVVVLIHGGCWRAQYSAAHVAGAAESLRQAGFATWVVEYRRVGNEGGGDPGTFDDIRAAYALLEAEGASRGLDLSAIALVGHSAGGHLALWLGAEPGVRARAVIGLAAVTDLQAFVQPSGCGSAVPQLLGGAADVQSPRYTAQSPVTRPPITARVHLIIARDDRVVPRAQADAFIGQFPRTSLEEVNGGHFDLVAPWSEAWRTVRARIASALR